MLRLKSLDISNIRSVEHLTIDVDPDGTTALFGPSGVGKSGILDALPWCLWGDTGSAGSAAAMRREGSTEPAQVSATILVGGDTIVASRRITRSESGNETASAKLWINDVKQANVTPASLTRIITDLTGLTAKTFRGAFYMAQGQLTDLITGTPAKVQETFEELTGLDDLSKRIQLMRDQHKEAFVRADALPGDPAEVERTAGDAKEAALESDRLQQEANTASREESAARGAWETSRDRAKELQRAERAARASRDAVVAADAVVAETDRLIDAARSDVHAAAGEVGGDPADNRDRARQECSRIEETLSTLTQAGAELKAATIQETGARSAAEQARAAHLAVDPDELAAAVAAAATAVENARSVYEGSQHAAAVAAATVTQRTDAVDTLTRALDAACCPTCQQSLDDVSALIADLRDQLAAAETVAREADNAVTVKHRGVLGAETALRKAQSDLAKVDSLARVAEHAEETARSAAADRDRAAAALATIVEAAIGEPAGAGADAIRAAGLAAHGSLADQLKVARAQMASWQALVDATNRRTDAVARVDQARAAVLDAPDPGDVAAAEAAEAAARRDLDEAQRVASEAAADAQAARATAIQLDGIADDAAARWAIKRAAADTAEETRIARDVVIGLRRDLLAEYCETISASATEVLMRLGGEHIGFTIDETFVPQVVLPDGTTRATRQLSGGEKARAAVCAFIGISRQLAGGGKPGMIFADEITASQDETFRREMLTMLRSLEMPMIVVSHTADVLDISSAVIRLQRPPLGSTQLAA
ncbi:AAA family ATPase [Prescottella agglutinans]|uniref:Nuclease SbcCD subunit C n=1 Tax=Prescottella agglutinans TaxID=1644129 RepID=A0ABT6MKL1_9NOCA|nr:AAA family ATPase [Prescottella agglutinans]MDH6284331.1 exonuclease SbcC [Prescottella agglutinans]